jgi:signal transduction histidine kinase
MARWIDELLDITRVHTTGELELDRTPTDLVELVSSVLAEQQAGAARHFLRLEAPAEPIVGTWDAARLRRVFDNLVGNAIKYSPLGGEVTLELAAHDGWAVAVVRDTGMGIPAADLPSIFEPFKRGSNVVGHIGGTGIGLASAYRIVTGHGGTIEVRSTPGRGSAFTVRLPLVPLTTRAVPSSATDGQPPSAATGSLYAASDGQHPGRSVRF